MRQFKSRYDSRYHRLLEDLLKIDGPDGLAQTALAFAEPIERNDQAFKGVVAIDLFGATGSTLLDRSRELAPHCLFDKVNDLSEEAVRLNAKGLAVRVRLLLLYPYSAAAQIRIQADHGRRRASVEEPTYRRGLHLMEQVTESQFLASSLYGTILRNVEIFSEWRRSLGAAHPLFSSPNRLELRFTTASPLMCGLRVNRNFFYDTYIYGKENRHQRKCRVDVVPLQMLNLRRDRTAFLYMCDHFRYLWEGDTTADMDDVVRREKDEIRILRPEEISFEAKAKRLTANDPTPSQETQHSYRIQAASVLRRHSPILRPAIASEVVFIGCSWRNKSPNRDARSLANFLQRYFSEDSKLTEGARMGINLVQGIAGQELGEILYRALDDATVGIVVLSAEVKLSKEKWLCRPNVYHELGYLMAHVGRERTFILREKTVEPPSNVGGMVHIGFDRDKIDVAFLELLPALRERGVILPSEARSVAERHLRRLEQRTAKGFVTTKEYDWAQNYIASHLSKPE